MKSASLSKTEVFCGQVKAQLKKVVKEGQVLIIFHIYIICNPKTRRLLTNYPDYMVIGVSYDRL